MIVEPREGEVGIQFDDADEAAAVIGFLSQLPADDRDAAFRDQMIDDLKVRADDEEYWLDLDEDTGRAFQVSLERYGDNSDAMRVLDAMSEAGI